MPIVNTEVQVTSARPERESLKGWLGPVLLCGGIGAAAGFGAAALLWRNRQPPRSGGIETVIGPEKSTARQPHLPAPQSPAALPDARAGSRLETKGSFAPGYVGPAKADVDQIRDANERNYTRGYATAVFAVRGGIVIDAPYGEADKYYSDPYLRGYEDGDAAKPPRYSNTATQASFDVASRGKRDPMNAALG